jgi:hypothetical protein
MLQRLRSDLATAALDRPAKALLGRNRRDIDSVEVIAAQQRCLPPSVGEALVFGDLSVPLLPLGDTGRTPGRRQAGPVGNHCRTPR